MSPSDGKIFPSMGRKGIFLRVEVLECGISEPVLLRLVGLEFSGCNGLLSTQLTAFKFKFGMSQAASYLNNQLWIFWKDPTLTLIQTMELEQVVHCQFNSNFWSIWISSIYGRHSRSSRRALWESISKCNPGVQPWILGGDFNCIHSIDEHKGSSEPCHNSIVDFRNCMEANNLLCLSPSGGHFSWSGHRSRGKVWRRLDHIFCNQPVLDQFLNLSLDMLSKGNSDHRPLLLKCSLSPLSGHKPFKFLNMWTSHHSLEAIIKNFWDNNKTYNGMQGLANKLKELKSVLNNWNREVFGNIFQKIKDAEACAKTTQTFYESHPSPNSLVAANKANAELLFLTKRESEFWQQKAGVKWIKEGDASSKFFHNLVKGKRLRLQISSIKTDEGEILEDKTEIATHAINFFSKLYKEDSVSDDSHIFNFIPKIINEEDNKLIYTLPQGEEVRRAIWDLNEHSASSLDGYNGVFFKTFWHIIQQEVVRASQEFFLCLPVPKSYGATQLTLIPKEDNPKSLGDYRPISLSNFLFKIKTKILSNRLRDLLPKLISREQTGFQAGKGVDENILFAQEMIHCLDNSRGSANVAIKVYLSKAFDRLSWKYLEQILLSFGFSHTSCHLLLATLKATHFSILINGVSQGFFKMERGIKQGDPLSPLLFILGSEGLSRMIKAKVAEGVLKAFNTGRTPPPSHLAYADDIIFFLNGHCRNLLKFKGLLNMFLAASGHQINLSKSHFYTGAKVNHAIKSNMERTLGMREGKLPISYLGATIGKGKMKKAHCKKVILHFDSYLNIWFSKNFFWGYWDGKPKYHWKNWRSICYPTIEGRLGIRHLEDIEAAYSTKLWWKLRNNGGIWGDYMRSKYCVQSFSERATDSVTWKRVSRIHNWAYQHVDISEGSEAWEGEEFSTKAAYNAWRDSKPISISCKMISDKTQIPKIKLFLWKAFNNLLPFPNNMSRFNMAIPSRCNFCKQGTQDSNHTLLQCPYSLKIWKFFSTLFQGPPINGNSTIQEKIGHRKLEVDRGDRTLNVR
ncbi:unnamed protein product [Cuscuta campestris]|uniref:Reverse transcriptase domain-containing protein n=1 Tax=Cuscuta campestris TaxID=132261 RepID=A0A484MG59_9ASTE|nr:unnamed protein product [Cuscuta campestris]